jgi:hypothetical protein
MVSATAKNQRTLGGRTGKITPARICFFILFYFAILFLRLLAFLFSSRPVPRVPNKRNFVPKIGVFVVTNLGAV